LLELVRQWECRTPIDFIPGIVFKRDGKLIFTTERTLMPIVDLPPKAYRIRAVGGSAGLCGRPGWMNFRNSSTG
jgi:hypothetical protein